MNRFAQNQHLVLALELAFGWVTRAVIVDMADASVWVDGALATAVGFTQALQNK